MTSYEQIYDRFLQKITDYKMLDLSDTEIRQECNKWLTSAIAKFRRCKNDLSLRDDELETFTIDLLDTEIEILSILMVGEWLAPQVNSVLYTSQFFGGKEEKLSDFTQFAVFGNDTVYSFEYAGKPLSSDAKTER